MTIFERIKGLCEQKGITINQFEKESGVGRGSVSRWEAHSPSAEKVLLVANYFGVSTDYLLTGLDMDAADDLRNLTSAQHALKKAIEQNPNLTSKERINILFDVSDYDPMVVAFNLDFDQDYLTRWIAYGDIPPVPIVNKILGVFQIKPKDLLFEKDFAAYEDEQKEWPAPDGRQELPEDAPDENYIILSRTAKKLSPEKRQQLLNMTIEEQLKQAILTKYKSVRAFTTAFNIPYSTLDSVFKRGISNAGVSTMIKIFNALCLDIESVEDGILRPKEPSVEKETPLNLSEADQNLMELFHELNDEGQEKLIDYADDLVTSGKYIKSGPVHMSGEKMA